MGGKIVSSHELKCFGVDSKKNKALEQSVTAIITIDQGGETIVMCQYFGKNFNSCYASNNTKGESGTCPYSVGNKNS